MIEIDKNVPLPPPPRNGPIPKYPWDVMEVGDSFFVPTHKSLRALVFNASKRRAPKKFITAREGSGHRVWRVE